MSNRNIYCVGVWKDQLTYNESKHQSQQIVSKACASDYAFVAGVAPAPFSYVAAKAILDPGGFQTVAQNIMWNEGSGSYIGETNARMLKEQGCEIVIVGHSERRMTFLESDEVVSRKMHTCLENGLLPIVCIGDTAEDRTDGMSEDKLISQIDAIFLNYQALDPYKLAIAYEPVWAISTWRSSEPLPNGVIVESIQRKIRGFVAKRTNNEFAERLSILYGGSVNPENGSDYLCQPNVDGALIGGASKTADSFLATLDACKAGIARR